MRGRLEDKQSLILKTSQQILALEVESKWFKLPGCLLHRVEHDIGWLFALLGELKTFVVLNP